MGGRGNEASKKSSPSSALETPKIRGIVVSRHAWSAGSTLLRFVAGRSFGRTNFREVFGVGTQARSRGPNLFLHQAPSLRFVGKLSVLGARRAPLAGRPVGWLFGPLASQPASYLSLQRAGLCTSPLSINPIWWGEKVFHQAQGLCSCLAWKGLSLHLTTSGDGDNGDVDDVDGND